MSELMQWGTPHSGETVRRIVDKETIEIPVEDAWLYSGSTMTVRFEEEGDTDE